MKETQKFLFDPLLFVVPIIIGVLGIFTLYSTSPNIGTFFFDVENIVLRQIVFLLIGLIIMILFSRINMIWTESIFIQFGALAISIITLIGLFLLGGLVNQTHRWYVIGPLLIQPSEFVKYILIFWVAFFLTRPVNFIKNWLILTLGVFLVLGLIFFQPDAGTTIMIGIVLFIMIAVWMVQYPLGKKLLLFGAGLSLFSILGFIVHPFFYIGTLVVFALLSWQDLRFLKLGAGLVVGLLVLGISLYGMWHSGLIEDYQKKRVLSFIGVEEETFQIHQSKIAIGSGQLFGKGIGFGTQSRLSFLPEYRTDFIFAAFVEERGFVGALLLLILYVILIVRMFLIMIRIKDDYVKLVALGLVLKLWIEFFVNIGMNVGLLPTKGVALPFMSYGGSSLISNFIMIGLFQSIYNSYARNDKIHLTSEFSTLV